MLVTIAIIIVAAIVISIPVVLVWYLNVTGLYQVLKDRKAKEYRSSIKKAGMTDKYKVA